MYNTVKKNAVAYTTDLLAISAKDKLAACIIFFCLRGGFGHVFHEAASVASCGVIPLSLPSNIPL
jgi:hypothetical protein